jgi:hypothetical protein
MEKNGIKTEAFPKLQLWEKLNIMFVFQEVQYEQNCTTRRSGGMSYRGGMLLSFLFCYFVFWRGSQYQWNGSCLWH